MVGKIVEFKYKNINSFCLFFIKQTRSIHTCQSLQDTKWKSIEISKFTNKQVLRRPY